MRVITITTFFPNAADRLRAIFVQNLVQAMQQRCDLEVISPVPFVPPLLKTEWRTQDIPRRERVEGIDVTHPRFVVLPKLRWFSGLGYFLGIAGTLRRLKQKHGRFVVHVHCAYPDAVGVALASKILRLPYMVTAHGSDINVHAEHSLLRPQIRWALRHAAGIVAVSGALEAKIARLIGRGKRDIARIPCAAVNSEVFFPRPRQHARTAIGLDINARIVVFVGQLVPIKGVRFLVDAWAELNKRGKLSQTDCLVFLGDGPERRALEQRVTDAGIASLVRFAGPVKQADVARWMTAANLLCLPSLNEGTPNVIVEALASGIPVVASRVGGIPDLIREGENGLLVPPTDGMALADALQSVLERDWQAQAVAASVAHLTWQAIAERNCDFLQTILDNHGTHN